MNKETRVFIWAILNLIVDFVILSICVNHLFLKDLLWLYIPGSIFIVIDMFAQLYKINKTLK